MVASVCVPEAALVPDQPPLAVQLVATGLVDQVSTGAKLPVAEVLLACQRHDARGLGLRRAGGEHE